MLSKHFIILTNNLFRYRLCQDTLDWSNGKGLEKSYALVFQKNLM